MIIMTGVTDKGVNFHANVNGLAVYLDNWAIGDLAEQDPVRRKRFINAIHAGADLMFSVTNAAELSGPQGASAPAIKNFLSEVGPLWFPVELNVLEVREREAKGVRADEACVSADFLKAYVATHLAKSGGLANLSRDIFSLGPLLDFIGSQRDEIRDDGARFDQMMKALLLKCRAEHTQDPRWLDRNFPSEAFHPSRRATFVFGNVLRNLVVKARSQPLKPRDAMNLLHAVMAGAFASVAALDKHWKRQIEVLPDANRLARIYYKPQLDDFVRDLESLVAKLRSGRSLMHSVRGSGLSLGSGSY